MTQQSSLLDYPPELSKALNGLEALWKHHQNPVYAWRAIELCLLPEGEDGNKKDGLYMPPLWCVHYLARSSRRIMEIAYLDPAPKGAAAYQRRLAEALGLISNGTNAFKNWLNELMRAADAHLFDVARAKGWKPGQIYEALTEAHEVTVSEVGLESERRKRQDRVTKGRRTFERWLNAQKPAR
jgi:hypothetical protein